MKNAECSRRRAVAALCRAAKAEMQIFFRSAYSTIVVPATKNVSPARNATCPKLLHRCRRAHSVAGGSFFILHSSFLNRRQTNSGVALVMVLGLLTVMVLMAVTFAITMRTERLAAGNSADNVRARELVHVGLARALNDMVVQAQYGLGTNGLSSPGSQVYPFWAVASSYDPAYTNTSEHVYLLYATNSSTRANEATNFVPRALWAAATNMDYVAATNHQDWVLIESVTYTNGGMAESNRMGRVKFLILNCSGLLDANFVGGVGTRGAGSNPSEIAITNLGEIGSSAGAATAFHNRRLIDVRYETLAQLNSVGDFYKPATNLFVYSRALPGYWNTNLTCVGTRVNLSGSVADLTNRMSEITNAFAWAGFSQFESGVLYSNLLDYVDSYSIPTNLEYCVENVPMINEIVCTNVIVTIPGTPPTYRSDFYLSVECWDPFIPFVVGSYDLSNRVDFSNIGAGTPELVPSSGYKVQSFNSSSSPKSESIPAFSSIAGADDNFNFRAIITSSILTNGIEIDRVIVTGIVSKASPSTGFECNDPRFNGISSAWQTETTFTMGNPNNCCTALLPTNDGDTAMFIANQPLRSVAELGYLVYNPNKPWKTVKLYGPNRHRVLDVFGLSTNTSDIYITNIIYRGLVNCNSNSALDATAAVFADMPVDQYPGEGGNTLLMSDAQAFVSRLFSGGICTNLSDVGRNLDPGDFTGATTELQREAYFRNTFNLLNLRQNVFTIIIEAQAASGGNIPRNPAKQRAVAIVWRDPYTGEMFVRHIKWLED